MAYIEGGRITFDDLGASASNFYNEPKKRSMRKKMDYSTLTLASLDSFVNLMRSHDFEYFKTNNNVYYSKQKKISVEIEEIAKNPEFNKIRQLYLEKRYGKIDDIRKQLVANK